ncbi:polycystic kidney disease protein 1-like 2 [Patella vulgata]|uniref:polycystic kidney disease protein 1-like 2 n=1 Tax=Patella vulgata TaxID=6465 RepID=UPI00217F68D7|nr:polycystic kidney disease protein 1-like 2 [Patella vulgata]
MDWIFIFYVSDISTPVDVRIYSAACFYWDSKHDLWSKQGLYPGNGTTVESVECLTNHLTDFGASFLVPPNTINFETVFNKFKDIGSNAAVLSTVCVVIGIYLIIVFIVRKFDQKDKLKWSIEPLSDNLPTDVYHYQVTVYTGIRRKAGTKSKVFIVLAGDQDETEVRALDDGTHREFSTASVNSYLMSVPESLGDLTYLRIWHDNTGKMADSDWYLSLVVVRDIQKNSSYVFLCDRWLSLTKDDGQAERFLPVATKQDLETFSHLFFFKTRQDITDGHIWFSVISRPTRSPFTRVQRLSCCLSLLFTTMIANAMWYRTTEGLEYSQVVSLGPFQFTSQEFLISIFMSIIVVPVNIIIVTFFRKSKSPAKRPQATQVHPKVTINDSFGKENTLLAPKEDPLEALGKRPEKKRFQLPHWCVYIAWFLVFASVSLSGFFTILYSLEWGAQKSGMWLTAFFLSFLESVIVVQPIKVVAVAVVVALISRSSSEHEDDDKEVDTEICHIMKSGYNKSIDPTDPAYPGM